MSLVDGRDVGEHAAHELRRGWPLLLAALIGGIPITVPLYATGVMIGDWEQRYGWTRGEIGLALTFYNGALILLSPVAGRIVDRFGVVGPVLLSLVLLCPAFLLLAAAGPALWTLYAAYTVFAVAGVCTTFVSFTRAINQQFQNARGVALSIACSSTTLSMFGAPVLAYLVLGRSGWQGVWLAFAMLVPVVCLIVWCGLRGVGQSVRRPDDAVAGEGQPLASITRALPFWLLAGAFLTLSFGATTPMLQLVPLLRSLGYSAAEAVAATSVLATGVAVSRLLTGFLLDRFDAVRLFQTIALVGIAGCLLLGLGSGPTVLVGVLCIGATVGAEGDILAYVTARYFGLGHYAETYGLLFSIMLAGAMLSPVTSGYVYDVNGNYDAALVGAGVAFIVALSLMQWFGVARAPSRKTFVG